MMSQPLCANWALNNAICNKIGRFACKDCRLITYCGAECQKSHWATHRKDCKSLLGMSIWQPDWVLENRLPAFVGDDPAVTTYEGRKYLWGNVPAFDVLKLGANEGEAYDEQLRLLFAASGDLRNVIKTIAQLPESYSQTLEVTMNDRDLDIVARNVILLLVALVVDDTDDAIDCIIHVWYSALLRKSDLDILQQRIRPIIEEVCHKLKGKAPNRLMAKTWTFGQRSMRLVLEKSAWDTLLTFTETPKGLTVERANEIRKSVTLAADRKDIRDRHLLFQAPFHRVALTRFREDGILLPFGASRNDFHQPNPTLFQDTESWPMHDNTDPLTGWSSKEVHETSVGPATADIYGKLFIYLRTLLRAFHHRLSDMRVSFRLFQMDASALPEYLEGNFYSRIEVSNISDAGYLGIHCTLAYMVPLLQSPLENPHATLITLFMNVVDENLTDLDRMADMAAGDLTISRILQYVPLVRIPSTHNDPTLFKVMMARDCVFSHDSIFDRHAAKLKFSETAQAIGAAMKSEHTVIEKWPFRLKLSPGQPGAQEEFDRLLCGGLSSKECYLEWKRV